jgi:hypothetical protein
MNGHGFFGRHACGVQVWVDICLCCRAVTDIRDARTVSTIPFDDVKKVLFSGGGAVTVSGTRDNNGACGVTFKIGRVRTLTLALFVSGTRDSNGACGVTFKIGRVRTLMLALFVRWTRDSNGAGGVTVFVIRNSSLNPGLVIRKRIINFAK